ncbi:MAG: GNAT family N-acetyltransferase [Nitrospirae bacterium]|nr:GNAT family N-acetyltransferase [Nitrospirota bacterium]MBF0541071.1 GNAT family N-acetyltransferase [Nitrospirota bacterium]
MDKRDLIIEGKNLYLKGIDHQYSDLIISWRNDENIGRFIQTERLELPTHQRFIDNYLAAENDFYFLSYTKDTHTPVGTVAIYNIDYNAEEAEYGRLVLPSEYRFYSVEIAWLAISFAFNTLKLKKVKGIVQGKNTNAIKLLKGIRFKKEQTLQRAWHNGDDVFIYVMYEGEFREFAKVYERLVNY